MLATGDSSPNLIYFSLYIQVIISPLNTTFFVTPDYISFARMPVGVISDAFVDLFRQTNAFDFKLCIGPLGQDARGARPRFCVQNKQ